MPVTKVSFSRSGGGTVVAAEARSGPDLWVFLFFYVLFKTLC
jgi:hypothetical protein